MQEFTTTVTTRDGVRLQVAIYEADSAEANTAPRNMLLLHGWPNSGAVWRDFADAVLLADPRYRLFAPDLRGYGDSEKPEGTVTCEVLAHDAEDIADALKLSDGGWTLIGHSMSGKLAQLVASHAPAGLAELVLLTPTPLQTPPLYDEAKAGLSAAWDDSAKIRAFIESLPGHPLRAEVVDHLVDSSLRVSRSAWDSWIYTMRDEALADAAAEIAVRTLVVAGGADKRVDAEVVQREVANHIEGARFVVLPSSGHLPHLEEPNALVAVVVNFLDASLPTEAA